MKRRDSMKTIAGIGIFSLLGKAQAKPLQKLNRMPNCILTPEQTAGPFYVDINQIRKDMKEGKEGVPLKAVLYVVEANTCNPIPNAVVDLWHADYDGAYSGFTGQGSAGTTDTTGQTFLRGVQITDEEGKAEFDTVFPGWYPGRAAHFHFRVHFQDQTYVTSQSYFPQSLVDEIYTTKEPYTIRGKNPTTNIGDWIFAGTQDRDSLVMTMDSDGDGYLASLTIGITGLPVGIDGSGAAPDYYQLDQNFPNPFNESTSIRFTLGQRSDVTVVVFDLLGNKLMEIHQGSHNAGKHTITWDGIAGNSKLAPGNYYYQLTANNAAGNFSQVRLMTVLKN